MAILDQGFEKQKEQGNQSTDYHLKSGHAPMRAIW
jgi:hypothetical protein